MNYYQYQADLVCEDCGKLIRAELTAAGKAPEDPDDETTYDSGEFPKGPYSSSYDESDNPNHCGMHANCENAFLGPGGVYVGVFLENRLTDDGRKYVEETCKIALLAGRDSIALDIWAPFYEISLEEDDNMEMAE